jgi:porin
MGSGLALPVASPCQDRSIYYHRFLLENENDGIEVMYQAQWTKWWTAQPEMQYIIRPGGGVLNSDGSLRPNAVVIALRSTISF